MNDDVLPPMPRSLYIETSSRCNLACTTCSLTYAPRETGRELAWDDFVRLVGQFPSLDRVVLHGLGEPLLNRNLGRMIAHCKARGAYVLFNTNGLLLAQGRQQELIEGGLDELRISLDAATPAMYERVRGAPCFARIIENLTALQETKERLGCAHPRLSLWMTGMKENLADLPELVRIAAQLRADEVNLQRLVFFGAGMAVDEQSIWLHGAEQEEALIFEAERLAQELGVKLVASGDRSASAYLEHTVRDTQPWSACTRPWNLSYITANGTVLPCCFAPWIASDYASVCFGNAFTQPFQEIWEGERYQAFRRALRSPEPHECCKGCGVKWSL